MAKHDRFEHLVFGKFLGLGFDHHHGVLGAGDDEVEVGLVHLVEEWVEDEFTVDHADAGGTDRAEERQAGKRQRGTARDHRDDVGVIFVVERQDRRDDLGFVLEAVDEERADGPVDEAGGQRFLFGRAAFALKKTAGNLTGGIGLFLVVHGQREEVHSRAHAAGGDDGREHSGVAVLAHHRGIGLTRDMAGFEAELAPAPIDFNSMDIEHCGSFVSVSICPTTDRIAR